MAVNEDEQSLHNNSAHSTGSKKRAQEEQEKQDIIEVEKKNEADLYGLLGLSIDGGSGLGGLDMQNETSLSAVDEKTWDTMDSVHSRASTVTSHLYSAGNSEDSFNYDGSNDSFASFGDSFNELSPATVEEIKDAFTDLEHEKPKPPPPRRAPLMKQNSLRFTRGASFRGSLNCVEEKSEEFELPHSLIEE
jgi:hypothetical protein